VIRRRRIGKGSSYRHSRRKTELDFSLGRGLPHGCQLNEIGGDEFHRCRWPRHGRAETDVIHAPIGRRRTVGTLHESCSSNTSVVGGLAEAATGPPGPASARRLAPGQPLTPEREHRDARSGDCGFELAILNQGSDPSNKAPPPPDLASLRQRELIRTNPGATVGVAGVASYGRGSPSPRRCFVCLARSAWQ